MADLTLKFLIGRKRGMTQRFAEDGRIVPLTVVSAGPCFVTDVRTTDRNGYSAIQLGFEECRPVLLSKPVLGNLGVERTSPDGKGKKAKPREKDAAAQAGAAPAGTADAAPTPRVGKPLRMLREARVADVQDAKVGDRVTVASFEKGDIIDVIGTSKGRGFMGTIRAHHFSRGPKSHGSMNVRQPGSVGSSADPSHTFRGTRMAKHLGAARSTAKNLRVFDVDPDANLLYIRGAVAGPTGGVVVVTRAKTPPPAPKAQPASKKVQKGGPVKARK